MKESQYINKLDTTALQRVEECVSIIRQVSLRIHKTYSTIRNMPRRAEIDLMSVQNSTGFTMQIYERIPATFGGEEPKFEISGRIKIPETGVLKNLPIPMIEKQFPSESMKYKYIRLWQRFQSIGLPVIPSLYHAKRSVFMPDLRAYGWELYGKSKLAELGRNQLQTSEKYDPLFLSIMRSQWKDIADQAQAYSQIATKNMVGLPRDDEAFILGIHESGKHKLFTLDLIQAPEYPLGIDDVVAKHNSRGTDSFMAACIELEQALSPRYHNGQT